MSSSPNTPFDKCEATMRATLKDILTEPHSDKCLTKLEQSTIQSLVGYAAYECGTDEDVIWSMVMSAFNAANRNEFAGRDYDKIVCFLVDFNFKTAIN